MDWKILPGPLLADAIWQATDQNSDGTISQAEADAWVAPFISEMTVTMDGQPVKFSASQDVHWPATVNVLRTGEDSVETTISIQWPANLTGKHSFSIHSAHLESNSLNWFSLTSQNGLVFAQPKQTNGRLEFDLYFPSSVNATPDS
ncbi:MAG TPA: hypothetical protein VMT73_10855, partial [Anaerolineales bacterium]|nr:hypothetical protein [Anaerolineales bacterium]